MPTYQCDYLSNGQRHRCRLTAWSAVAAAETMRRLPWAPGCGPVGEPKRIGNFGALTQIAAQVVAAALVIIAVGTAATLLKPGPVEIAAGDAVTQAR